MKFKYCPNCGGISTMAPHAGMQKCSRCNFVGEPNEGTAAEANSLAKRIKSGMNPLTNAQQITQNAVPQKLDAPSMQSLKDSALKPESKEHSTHPILSERLRKLKGKSTDNFEFL